MKVLAIDTVGEFCAPLSMQWVFVVIKAAAVMQESE
jgi:hypothetical protein